MAINWAWAWGSLDLHDLDGTKARWMTVAGLVTGVNRSAAIVLGTDFIKSFTAAKIITPSILNPSQFAISMSATGIALVKKVTGRGGTIEQAGAAGMSASYGSASRMVLDAQREVITKTSSSADDIRGWIREGEGDCDFCQGLIGQETSSEDFPSHDRCNCVAVPIMKD